MVLSIEERVFISAQPLSECTVLSIYLGGTVYLFRQHNIPDTYIFITPVPELQNLHILIVPYVTS
jgi:hypothetical protein